MIDRELQNRFEDLTERIRAHYEAVGIAVAIVDAEGNTQYQNFFGSRDAEKKQAIDENTIFGLASVSKSFTALSIMQLAERGLVDLDAPVSRYIPEFTNKNQEPVLVRHFLNHSGGFYPLKRIVIKEVAKEMGLTEETAGDLGLHVGIAVEGAKQVAERLDAQTRENGLIGAPGEYLSYCNDGFGMLSEIIRKVGGEETYAAYVKKNILEPLGMGRSGGDFVRPLHDPNAVTLYKKSGGVMTGGWDYYDNAFVLGGGGTMKSTLSDMKQYVTMYLNRGRALNGNRLLSEEGIARMCTPTLEYRPGSRYGFGLSIKPLDDLTIVEHGGSLTGISSNMSWCYEKNAAVIVLCNTTGVPSSVIADAAMRMYCGKDPLTKKVWEKAPWSEETKQAACGKYVSGEGNILDVSLEADGNVALAINGEKQKFITVGENLGIVPGYEKNDTVKLFCKEDGKVFAIGFGGRIIPKVQ